MKAQTPALDAHVEKVTPQIAEEWLGKNVHNRNIRGRIVDAYARDMAAGRWRLTGEAVKFSTNGTLLDGQHRLQAVIRAGVPVELFVLRGLEPETQEVMDSGSARTAGDALRLRGQTARYTSLAAAARLGVLRGADTSIDGSTGGKVTTLEILDFLDANPDLVDAVEMAVMHKTQIDVPMSVLSLAIFELSGVDTEACDIFITRVAEKTHLVKGDAILALNERLAEIRRTRRHASRADYLSLIFRAWNYWRTDKTVAALPLRSGRGSDAVDIPQPL